MGDNVLGNTASAILQVRDHLNRETIDCAIDPLTAADRIEFYILRRPRNRSHPSSSVAADAVRMESVLFLGNLG